MPRVRTSALCLQMAVFNYEIALHRASFPPFSSLLADSLMYCMVTSTAMNTEVTETIQI